LHKSAVDHCFLYVLVNFVDFFDAAFFFSVDLSEGFVAPFDLEVLGDGGRASKEQELFKRLVEVRSDVNVAFKVKKE
jgi:hypothetical protein